MKKSVLLLTIPATLLSLNALVARENVGQNKTSTTVNSNVNLLSVVCTPAKAKTDLDINNVRTTIMTGGDMWWDLANGKYEIPKDGKAHSIFAGSLWIGGYDAGGNLKVAGMTYRQTGNDFWPGPMDTVAVSIDKTVCDQYDKHFKMTRKEVDDFVLNGAAPTSNILNWPGNGDYIGMKQSKYLAPFYDKNGNGIYEPGLGDYPDYNVTKDPAKCTELYGDQTLWWVFNDVGNIHSETKSTQPIGLEIHAQAFAFNSNDEINDMTFYNYKVINRSSFKLDSCYFGVWCDPDLGNYQDDYVGCDVANGLGYCYNGDGVDGTGAPGEYGNTPPAVGIDFFQGPLADPGDGVDNDRDGTVDEVGEQIIMSKFMYYNNTSDPANGNPSGALHFYRYLAGRWGDGIPTTYGGDGRGGGSGATAIPCDFMFPGDSDLKDFWGTKGTPVGAWDEVLAGNTPADRRFLQSAGIFSLQPGAINKITTGVVWARTSTSGGNISSILKMRVADKKAQALFNNCFKVTDGPDAPDLIIQEVNNQFYFYLTNGPSSNNYREKYSEDDPVIGGTKYFFQGYKIYQLKYATISVNELDDPAKARLVKQMDTKDSVGQIINFTFKADMQNSWEPVEKVNGENAGVVHSFVVDKDLFASGDDRLINHKQYYYMAVAYGYNAFEVPPNSNPFDPSYKGLGEAYLQGRNNVNVYTGIPHEASVEAGGTDTHSTYGSGPKITRKDGQGNGGMILDLSAGSVNDIMNPANNSRSVNLSYESGKGPVNIKVVDPLSVTNYSYELKFDGVASTSNWTLTNKTTGDVITSDNSIGTQYEQLLMGKMKKGTTEVQYNWGIALTINQVPDPGTAGVTNNGVLEATLSFSDPGKAWLTGVVDNETVGSVYNWIRSGTASGDYLGYDDGQNFEKMIGGTWAPYRMCSQDSAGPAWQNSQVMGAATLTLSNKLAHLGSVDVVFTSDKNKWTRCPVLIMTNGANKFFVRGVPSVDKNGNPANPTAPADTLDPNSPNFMASTGMGWFPGYAINVETGERLNMAFGEDTMLTADNGNDMKWNPTDKKVVNGKTIFGGKHYIYIFGHHADTVYGATNGTPQLIGKPADVPRYDGGRAVWSMLKYTQGTGQATSKRRDVFADVMWVNLPLAAAGYNISDGSLIPSEAKVRLRVSRGYRRGLTALFNAGQLTTLKSSKDTLLGSNKGYPMYSFNTADLETHLGDEDVAKDALDLINVVPNPYYAYSAYETNQADNRVKVTNLPVKCTISIYTVNGTLIRKIKKDDPAVSVDWDLRNTAGIPVASGLYIIHVDAGNIGEKTLKWFGVMRPIDLDAF